MRNISKAESLELTNSKSFQKVISAIKHAFPEYNQSTAKSDDTPQNSSESVKTSLAIAYANLLQYDPEMVTFKHLSMLYKNFTLLEIGELTRFILNLFDKMSFYEEINDKIVSLQQ
ncbi:MAG: hypothetical protein AAFX87_03380 [Bacteroidota bacterium]